MNKATAERRFLQPLMEDYDGCCLLLRPCPVRKPFLKSRAPAAILKRYEKPLLTVWLLSSVEARSSEEALSSEETLSEEQGTYCYLKKGMKSHC